MANLGELHKIMCRTSLEFIVLQDALEMDPIIRGRPVILQSKDGHALWISKKALELSSPWPSEIEGGVIMKDSFGNPSGSVLSLWRYCLKIAYTNDQVCFLTMPKTL
jgi:predicted amidohydrolase YtcJ